MNLMQHFSLFCLIMTLAACGDSPQELKDNEATQKKPSLFSLRNRARLHGRRDSEEGFQESAEILDQILLQDPKDLRALMDRLRCALQIDGQAKQALALLAKIDALEVPSSQRIPLAFLRGVAHKRNQNHKVAWKAFTEVTQALPEHPQGRYQAGWAAEKAQEFPSARIHFEELVSKKLLVRPAAYRLYRVLQRLGDKNGMKKALEIYESRPSDEKPATEKCSFMEPSVAPILLDESLAKSPPLVFTAEEIEVNPPSEKLANSLTWVSADFDNSGIESTIVINKGSIQLLASKTSPSESQTLAVEGAKQIKAAGQAIAIDTDHDGDLDVVFFGQGSDSGNKLMLLRNLSHAKFKLESLFSTELADSSQDLNVSAGDFDEGNDIDIVVAGGNIAARVAMNLRNDQWRAFEVKGQPRSWVVSADFTQDGMADLLAVGSSQGASLFVNTNREKKRAIAAFSDERKIEGLSQIWRGAKAADLDNDGDLDCILWGQGVRILRNRGQGHFDVETPTQNQDQTLASISVLDRDQDGRLEIELLSDAGKTNYSLEVASKEIGNAIALVPDGRKDNRDGVGAIVEVFAGQIHTTRMVLKGGPLHFGLGKEQLDGFAIRWPQGIRQSVVGKDLDAINDGLITVKQKQGLVASCPFLFTKGENGWTYKSDIVGIAPLDEWLPRGAQPHLDPEEFIRIDEDELIIENGQVRLAITEELREITYLDRVELYYIDKSPRQVILTDESTRQEAYGPLRFWETNPETIHPPASVTVDGKDVLAAVRACDGNYLHGYRMGPSQLLGWGPRHDLEIELSNGAEALFLQGRLAWYDSTTSYAMAQKSLTWEEPRLEILREDGRWAPLVQSIGFPAGMDRSLIIRFPGGSLSSGRKIRLISNQRFLWDRIALISHLSPVEIATSPTHPISSKQVQQAEMITATLFDRGFSRTKGSTENHEQRYLWQADPKDDFDRARGWATAFGDVKERLLHHDDSLCILVSADAIALSFAVEPKASQMKRTWFLRVTGWAKESSFHNQSGRDIAPLPHRSMKSYPPATERHRQDQTRRVTR